jgi:putative spermidine/putrescine transport system substrate-binding protein
MHSLAIRVASMYPAPVTAIAMWLAFAIPATASEAITYAGAGGTFQAKLVEALLTPAVKIHQAELIQTSFRDVLPALKLEVQSGKPAWDIVQTGADSCATASRSGLLEPIDYKVVRTDGLPKEAYARDWVSPNYYSFVLAWRNDVFPQGPKNWADFFDVKRFKGPRALASFPQGMLEIALLADGVEPANLYPIDVDRALNRIRTIKSEISVWWATGAQSAQLLKDGEVDMMAIWGSRVEAAVQSGAPVSFTFDHSIINYNCFAIPKGSAHKELAMRVIAATLTPEIQANIPKLLPYYGPTNKEAYKVGLSAEVVEKAKPFRDMQGQAIPLDVQFWAEHLEGIVPRYRAMIAE